jgi:hypothetical protein
VLLADGSDVPGSETKANEHMAKAAGPITVNRDLSPSNTMSIHKPLVIGAGSGAWTTLGQGGKTQ